MEAMDKHAWGDFTILHCGEEKESLENFFANERNEVEHVGVQNVMSASLIELVEVALEDVADMLHKKYSDKDVKIYVLGVDYEVFEDSKYYSTGVNYNFIVLVREDGEWKVSEMLPISEPQRLLDNGYMFSNHYDMAVNVMRARREGSFINYEGEKFDSWSPGNNSMSRAVINKWTVPSDNTPVRYKGSDGTIQTLSFHQYCLGVLAGEMTTTSFDGAVRQAQAIATKTFTWHFIIVPKGASEGYDINYVQQDYQPTRISENRKTTVDYNSVRDIWMESYRGAIFEASYKAGYDKDPSAYKEKGEFKQNGALWLYENNVVTDYKGLLKYFYDNSLHSQGGPIRFFDSMKNEL